MVLVVWLLPTLGTLALLALLSRVQGFIRSLSYFGPPGCVVAFAILGGTGKERYEEAAELLDGLIVTDDFIEFLTFPAYELLG